MSNIKFIDEHNITTVDELHKLLPNGPSQYHNPALKSVEQEILGHFKQFSIFCNVDCIKDPYLGKRFYDLKDAMYFDLMGTVPRGTFGPHYDVITPYLKDATSSFDELEVVAVTPTFGYSTMYQRLRGKTTDGDPFDFRYRLTSIMRKINGEWKYVHEHLSYPTDMKTRQSDFTSGMESGPKKELDVKVS